MTYHKNLSGPELHKPMGTFENGPLEITDDTGGAYIIQSGSDTYVQLATTNGSEEVTLGNATNNPKCTVAGTGLFTTGGGQKVAMATITGPTNPDLNASHYVSLVNTTGGVVTINLVTPSTVANQTFVFIDSHSQFGTHNLILARAASENIDNVASNKTISTNNARLTLFCDGTNWFTVIDTSSATSGIAAVVDDTTPQLGGNLDCNGNNIDVEAGSAIAVDGGSIQATTGYGVHDEANNEQLLFTKTTSAINYLNITNAATGGEATAATSTAPILEATSDGGGDANVDFALAAKGTGTVTIRGNTNSGTLTLNAESNTKYVNIKPPLNDDLTSYTLTLPGDDGDADQVLKTDGSGNLDWVDQAAGGGSLTYQAKTSTFTAVVDYFYGVDSSGGDVTVNLPAVSGNAGKTIDVNHLIIGNDIIFDGNASETINGATTLTVGGTQYQNVTLFCTGTEWLVR
jgi:hypothetical protein